METKNILIPFVGFYESIASKKAEDIAFGNFIHYCNIKENAEGRLDIPEDMTQEDQENFWNYYDKNRKELQKSVAEDYINALNKELGLTMKFESISSPAYYNYTTDRLFVDVPTSELIHLYNKVDQAVLAEMIKERHTSRPGFDSYYENDINDPSWQDPTQYDHNQWETVVDAYIKQNNIDVDELYYI